MGHQRFAFDLIWAQSRRVSDVVVPSSILGWDLGDGESQVLAHCLLGGHLAVLDDGEARAAAKVHAVPLVGTLGVILRARRAGLVPAAAHWWTLSWTRVPISPPIWCVKRWRRSANRRVS